MHIAFIVIIKHERPLLHWWTMWFSRLLCVVFTVTHRWICARVTAPQKMNEVYRSSLCLSLWWLDFRSSVVTTSTMVRTESKLQPATAHYWLCWMKQEYSLSLLKRTIVMKSATCFAFVVSTPPHFISLPSSSVTVRSMSFFIDEAYDQHWAAQVKILTCTEAHLWKRNSSFSSSPSSI